MFLKESELLEYFHISRTCLYNCRKQGLPIVKIGNKVVRYDYEEVLKRFEENSVKR